MAMRPPVVDDLTKLRFIIAQLFNPCDAPWFAYFELSAKPLLKLYITLFAFDFQDFVQELVNPKSHGKKRKGRKNVGRGPKVPGIPDMAEEAAKIIKGDELIPDKYYTSGTKVIFIFAERVQYLTYMYWLIEEQSDIAMDAIFGVIEKYDPDCNTLGRYLGSSADEIYGGAGPLWKAIGATTIHYAVNCNASTGFAVFLPEGRWVVTAAATIYVGGDDSEIGLRILDTLGEDRVLDSVGPVTMGGGDEQDFIVAETVEGPATIQWEAMSSYGFARIVKADFSALEVIV